MLFVKTHRYFTYFALVVMFLTQLLVVWRPTRRLGTIQRVLAVLVVIFSPCCVGIEIALLGYDYLAWDDPMRQTLGDIAPIVMFSLWLAPIILWWLFRGVTVIIIAIGKSRLRTH